MLKPMKDIRFAHPVAIALFFSPLMLCVQPNFDAVFQMSNPQLGWTQNKQKLPSNYYEEAWHYVDQRDVEKIHTQTLQYGIG